MENRDLEIGDVVQIKPESHERFGGCFMVVTVPTAYGAQGYIVVPGEKGVAYHKCAFGDIEFVGRAKWVLKQYGKITDS